MILGYYEDMLDCVLFLRLCRLDGTPITSSRQLVNNQYYVAVGTERFRLLPYFHWVPWKNTVQGGSLG